MLSATGAAAGAPPSLAFGKAGGDGSLAGDLARYHRFGFKASGGAGDQAVGAWLERRITALGYRTQRQTFRVPFFDVRTSVLTVGDLAIEVTAQAPWRATPEAGVEGRLARWPAGPDVRGGIAVIRLPFRRWSAFRGPDVEAPVRAALAGGAVAVVLVTTGPSGEALRLNVSLETPPVAAPVVVLAPREAERLWAHVEAGAPARLTVTGALGERPAYNLIGRLERGAGRWLVISTPRSGWFGCAGERGPGIAAWLALAAWARATPLAVDVLLVSASGHEREYAGAKLFLKREAPPPFRTAFWLHLGANVAAQDWHELGPRLTPLPSADPQRFLVVEKDLLASAQRAFLGQPGLEAPYSPDQLADGELGEILQAGYVRAAGVFGAHRFHHAVNDDLRCVEPAHVEAAIGGFKRLITEALAQPQQS